MPDQDVSYGRIREQSRFDNTGAEIVEILVPIYIGKHGPFTERFTKVEYTDGITLRARVDALRRSLDQLPG